MIHTMLPVQYLREPSKRLAEPERRLALAVLQTVMYDCRAVEGPPEGRARVRDRRAYGQAMAYIASRDRSWPYSFENLCDSLGVDAAYLRQGISRQWTVEA